MIRKTSRGAKGAILTRYKGKPMTCQELARIANQPGVDANRIKERLRAAKFPPSISKQNRDRILGPLKDPKEHKPFEVDGVRYSARGINREFGACLNRLHRAKKKGITSFTKEQLVEMVAVPRNLGPLPKDTTANPEPPKRAYQNPDYLPHITCGDLAHLSGEVNTGAGKGEIPDEEWIEMIGSRRAINTMSVNLIGWRS